MKKPLIYVISGPSGAGKTTLLKRLFLKEEIKNKFLLGISFTTRKKRPQEKEGKDYFFVSKERFNQLKKEGFFLETQQVLDDYYGTPKYFLQQAEREKKNLLLCVDVRGGIYLKKLFKADKVVTIFISVSEENELYRRLQQRAEEEANIKKRIELAKEELKFLKYYDYLVINQELSSTVNELEEILRKTADRWRKRKGGK